MSAPQPALISGTDARTAKTLLDAIDLAFHSRKSEWIFLRELRIGVGRQNGALQRVDALALNTLPHTAMKRVCYEVKVSRADFLCELRQPLKRRIGMRYSNEFYFVTPPDLCAVEEIPSECGLIEAGRCEAADWRGILKRHAGFFCFDPATGLYAVLRVQALWRDTPGPSWQFMAAILRHQQRVIAENPPPPRPIQEKIAFE